MEEFLKDKIFQFYYKKIYGQKSNYHSFKTFSDKDKVSFLINLYLFISNVNNNNNNNLSNANLNQNIQISNENSEKKSDNQIENDFFYRENYNIIMNNFKKILNKYNNKSKENDLNNENNNNNAKGKYNNNNKKEKLFINNNKNYKQNLLTENIINNIIGPSTYIKYNYNYESNNKENNDEDNHFKEQNDLNKKGNIIISKKNDINISINKPPLKPGSSLYIIKINSKNNKINTLTPSNNKSNSIQNFNKNLNENKIFIKNENKNNRNNIINSIENNTSNKNTLDKDNNLDDKLILYKSCQILYENESLNSSEDKLLVKDLVLINQTMTEKSRINYEEFKNGNIVEKLIKCPQNKYISLESSEANKLALVIINLLESKNELGNEIEEERKKNEMRLNKLNLDFNRQKKEIKSNYDKREINIMNTLNLLKKEIDIEKQFLDDNVKSYHLWDKVSIENQKTKEIRENIIKKLESIKK